MVYIDPNGVVTIGPGFALGARGDADVLTAVFRTLGFKVRGATGGISPVERLIEDGYIAELTDLFHHTYPKGTPKFDPTFLANVDEVMNRRYTDTRLSFARRPIFSFDSALDAEGDNAEMKSTLNGFISVYEGRSGGILGSNIAASTEKAALVSLVYHNRRNLNADFVAAFDAGDRAQAWYALRYNQELLGNAVTRDGFCKRRLYAADLFGLYDAATVSPESAKDAYRMLTLHRGDIESFLKQGFMHTEAQLANATWHTTVAKTLEQDFDFAREALIADLLRQHPDIGAWSSVRSTDIYLDPGRDRARQPIDPNHFSVLDARDVDASGAERATRNIIIGEGGNDSLVGSKGDDLLLGGDGNDVYYYRVGDGNDRIIDSDGRGHIIIDDGSDAFFAGGYILETGTGTNIWSNTDGTINLTHNSPWTLHLADGSTIELAMPLPMGTLAFSCMKSKRARSTGRAAPRLTW